MKISTIRLTCKCGHVFDGELVVEAPIAVALVSMKAIRCPKCSASKGLLMGGEFGSRPPVTMPIQVRANWWIKSGDRGISSETIYWAYHQTGMIGADIPYDPDDFSRCRKLFDLMPEWRADLSEIVGIYEWYRPFVDRWDEMDRLWDEEAPTKKCPKLYGLMKVAEAESRAIRYPKSKKTA